MKRLRSYAPFEIHETTTSNDRDVNRYLIKKYLESKEHGLIIVASGDGTFNQVTDTIVGNDLSDWAKTKPIWSIGGGNADDGVHAKHTREYRKHPEWVLEDGMIVETYPIRCEIQRPDDVKEVRSGTFYASLGMTALASSDLYLNRPEHRKSIPSSRTHSGCLRYSRVCLA